jgi:hypothetical protein
VVDLNAWLQDAPRGEFNPDLRTGTTFTESGAGSVVEWLAARVLDATGPAGSTNAATTADETSTTSSTTTTITPDASDTTETTAPSG